MTPTLQARLLCMLAAFVPAGARAQIAQTGTSAAESMGNTRSPANPAGTAYPAEAAGDGATTNGYNLSRWAEDWTKFKDPAKRKDAIDRLKYLPIDEDANVYLTLSGEARLRFNLTTNPGLREVEAQRQDIVRLVGGADLHLGDHFRLYGELAHGSLEGENLGTIQGTFRNDLAVQQLFGEVKGNVGGANVGARIGRQEFTDGISLLVSSRDNNTIRFVLDGARAWAQTPVARVDMFDFRFVNFGLQGLSDDPTDGTTRFSGVNLGFVVPKHWFGGSKLYVDPLFWRLRSREQTWGAVDAREERIYYGGRLWGTVGPLTLDYTLTREEGRFGNREIGAWQAFAAQTYRLGKGDTAPRIGLRGDYGSGGGVYGDTSGKLKAAFSPFGNNIYYGYGLFLAPVNFIDLAPNFTFTPVKKVRLTAEYELGWRATKGDAVYRANGTPYAGTQLVGGSSVAQVARLQAVWSISPRLAFTGRLEHIRSGNVLKRAGYKDSAFGAGWLSFRF